MSFFVGNAIKQEKNLRSGGGLQFQTAAHTSTWNLWWVCALINNMIFPIPWSFSLVLKMVMLPKAQ